MRAVRARARPLTRLVDRENRRFDRRLGIETEGAAEPIDLTVDEGDAATGFTYVPTPVRVARWWLRELPPEHERFTFVDMGSGKGRVLAIAACDGFARVVGVEFARELHDSATANAAAARARGVVFEPELGDAGAYGFPPGPLVVHFNNPFAEPVMARVVRNLTTAYEAEPRPIAAVYQQLTVEHGPHATTNLALLDAVPFLTGRSLTPSGWLDRRVLAPFTVRIFESPEASALRRPQ